MSHCTSSGRPESFMVHRNGMSTMFFAISKKVQSWEEKTHEFKYYVKPFKQYTAT